MTAELSPRKQPKQARAKATVEAILQAAAQVLVNEGYEKASTNRVAKVAGVSVGSLYQYFPNKDAMYLALADEHSAEMISMLQEMVSELLTAPVPEAVRTYIDAMLRAHLVDPALHQELTLLLPRLQTMNDVADLNKQAELPVRMWLEAHRDEIQVGDLDTAAFILVNSVEMVTHAALVDRPHAIEDGTIAEELTKMILGYLLGPGRSS